jgi:heme/copper-type cytochrome/quinol oxidase subunit 2
MYINILILLAVIVGIYSLVISVTLIRKQQRQKNELDRGIHSNAVKHPVIGNPIVIFYLLFPIVVVVGAILWGFFKL